MGDFFILWSGFPGLSSGMLIYLTIGLLIAIISDAMVSARAKAARKNFADKLFEAQICSDENHQTLLREIKRGRIKDEFSFLTYCDNAVIINLDDYSDEPVNYLEEIHTAVARLLPELTFSGFGFKIISDEVTGSGESLEYKFVVSMTVDGKTYHQESFYRLYCPAESKYSGRKIDQQSFYKIFNQILAEKNADYRIHEVKDTKETVVAWNRFAMIVLTKEQADLLHGPGVLFRPGFERFGHTLNSGQIDRAIAEYKRSGLFGHLSESQIDAGKAKAARRENGDLNDVLRCFPDIVLDFDSELDNLEDPYAELLKALSRISGAAFNPANIEDGFVLQAETKVTVGFTLGSKRYSCQLTVEDDWVDPDFFSWVSQAGTESHIPGQFYHLFTGDQTASLIFLTQEQEKFLRENNLLLFDDQSPSAAESSTAHPPDA